mgnify:CR=1 FL=1
MEARWGAGALAFVGRGVAGRAFLKECLRNWYKFPGNGKTNLAKRRKFPVKFVDISG